MNNEQAENLISRITKYFEENPVIGEFRLNECSVVLNGERYIEKNIAVLKNSKVNTMQFSACYSRLQELKAFVEKNKVK